MHKIIKMYFYEYTDVWKNKTTFKMTLQRFAYKKTWFLKQYTVWDILELPFVTNTVTC